MIAGLRWSRDAYSILTAVGTKRRSERIRIAVLGSQSDFTVRAVQSLCESGVPPVAWLTGTGSGPRAAGPFPVEVRDSATRLAAAHGVELIRESDPNHPAAAAALKGTEPDLLLIACLPHVVRHATRCTARLGALNLHPAALPLYRGPDPVFWQLRDGIAQAGVTIHLATDAVDSGPVVAQQWLEVDPGISEHLLTTALVKSGIDALVDMLPEIERHIRRALPQDESVATYRPRRHPDDFRFDTSWTAERAYRFIEGTRGPGIKFSIASRKGDMEVTRAVGFEARARVARSVEESGGIVKIRFAEGMLRAVPVHTGTPARVTARSLRNRDLRHSNGSNSF